MPPVLVYATLTQFAQVGAGEGAIARFGESRVEEVLEIASREMDDYFSRFTLPFVAISTGITVNCCAIAAFHLFSAHGYNPEGDTVIRQRYEDAKKWLLLVAEGKVVPGVTDSSPGAEAYQSPARARVSSASSRGWSKRGTDDDRGPFQSD